MRNCFFVTTPFQILTSISVVEKISGLSDLYVIDQFPGADQMVLDIEDTHIFNKVALLRELDITGFDRKKDSYWTILTHMIRNYLWIEKAVKRYLPEADDYSDVYSSTNHVISRLTALYIKKKKHRDAYHRIDDGIGTYFNSTIYRLSRPDYWGRRLLIGKEAVDLRYDLYLYSPEMYAKVFPDLKIETHKISFLGRSSRNDEVISTVFGIKEAVDIRQRIVFFDTVRKALADKNKEAKMDLAIAKIIADSGESDFLVKPHPRDTEKRFQCEYYLNTSVPMECLCYYQDYSDKVLVSIFSTAVFTPKLLFDQEPGIVLLYKLYSGSMIEEKDRVCSYIRELYNKPEKIFVPETEEELYEYFGTIQKGRT